MQIFVLDSDQEIASKMHADKHLVKQVLESAQLLSSTMRIHGLDYGYKITHRSHPCRVWLDESKANFNWLKLLGMELSKEYTYRYGKIHKSQSIIEGSYCPKDIEDHGLTKFALAMPNEYKTSEDPVICYRNYYIGAKKSLLTYTKRRPPEWLNGIATWKDK
jgi:hypothetical protein